ncbi:MAG: hypothetical protein WBV55_15840, partial [Candidatus Sulfotelmatobacter sp.]
ALLRATHSLATNVISKDAYHAPLQTTAGSSRLKPFGNDSPFLRRARAHELQHDGVICFPVS